MKTLIYVWDILIIAVGITTFLSLCLVLLATIYWLVWNYLLTIYGLTFWIIVLVFFISLLVSGRKGKD